GLHGVDPGVRRVPRRHDHIVRRGSLMSTTTMDAPVVVTPPTKPDIRLSFGGVLRSEWIKLRSVRSSALTLLGAAFAMLTAGLVFASTIGSGGDGPGPR